MLGFVTYVIGFGGIRLEGGGRSFTHLCG